jgi:hypothetical protein
MGNDKQKGDAKKSGRPDPFLPVDMQKTEGIRSSYGFPPSYRKNCE